MSGAIGFLLLMVGAGGMDSQNLIIPAAMAISGLLMLWAESKKTIAADQSIRTVKELETTKCSPCV